MEKYDAIIVGGGVGGLTCGAFLAQQHKRVLILEQHFKPGGCVTSFARKGFHFDVPSSICSTGKQFMVGQILDSLGMTDRLRFIELEKFLILSYPDRTITFYADLEKFRYEIAAHFPHERAGIDRFITIMRNLRKEAVASYYRPNLFQYLSYPFRFPALAKYQNKTYQQVLDSIFRDEKLKDVLCGAWPYLGVAPTRLSAVYMMGMYMCYLGEGTHYPSGGFQVFADALAARYRELGGELRLKSPVADIIIAGKRAAGVELESGERIGSDCVISNANTKSTFLSLVGERHLSPTLKHKFNKLEMSPSGFNVHLGVRMHVSNELSCSTLMRFPGYGSSKRSFELLEDKKIETDPDKLAFGLEVRSLADQSLAPAGCHSINILGFAAPDDFHNALVQQGPKEYESLKQNIKSLAIKAAESIIPDLSRHIVVSDVSTPLTYQRYLRVPGGAWYDAACTPGQANLNRTAAKTDIPGLFLAGANTYPGSGIIGAMWSGLCTADTLLEGSLLGGRAFFR